jgi:hypothetical protein
MYQIYMNSNALLYTDKYGIISNIDITHDDFDKILANSITQEYNEIYHYKSNTHLDINLYLMNDGIIIAYLDAGFKTDSLIEIRMVNINPLYQNKKLCKRLIKLFLMFIEIRHGILNYILINVGEIPGCRCYINAFKYMGYKTSLNIDECDNKDKKMSFSKIINQTKNNKPNNKSKSRKLGTAI